MIRQTGGEACGATSTRSRSAARAMARASGSGLMPTCSPSAETKRTSRARIRSLIRGSVVTGGGMAPLLGFVGSGPTDHLAVARTHGPGAPGVAGWGRRSKARARFPVRMSSVGYPAVAELWTPGDDPATGDRGAVDGGP